MAFSRKTRQRKLPCLDIEEVKTFFFPKFFKMLIYEIPFSGKWISTKTTVHYIKKGFKILYFYLLFITTSRGHWWKYFSWSKNMKSNGFYKGCGFYIKAEKP